MKIFICWSGARAFSLADTLVRWLPRVVDEVEKPFLSSQIRAGTRWFEEVAGALNASHAGLVCLTPENRDAAWIQFEAGALTLAVKGILYTYTHNVPPERMPDPLKPFQSSTTTRESTWHMVKSIAQQAGREGLQDEAALAARFEQAWPELERVIADLDAITIETAIPGFQEWFVSKTFTEPMPDCHDRSWTGRFERLARVDAVLQEARPRVAALGEPHLLWLFDQLLENIARYLMNMRSVVLLTNDEQQIRAADIPGPLMQACETSRIRILQLRNQLLDPSSAPVLRDAVRYQGLDTAQRKELGQAYESRIAAGESPIPAAERRRALDSIWDFDRMVSYKLLEAEAVTPQQMLEIAHHVRRELERAETRTTPGSLVPLYCSVRALDTAAGRLTVPLQPGRDARLVLDIAGDVEQFVSADPADRDARGKFASRLRGIRTSLGAAPAA